MRRLRKIAKRLPLPVKRLGKPLFVRVVHAVGLAVRFVHVLKVFGASRVKGAWTAAGGACSFVASASRRRSQIVEQIAGSSDLPSGRRVAIFSHYDPSGAIRPYVRYYVDELIRAGFTVVFVTNGPEIGLEARVWLERCALALRRRNVGRDFGSYKDAIDVLGDPSRFDALLLTNDSVYGPLTDLVSVLDRCDFEAADVWGVTDSPQHRRHLQSYFVLLGPRALRSHAFEAFWPRVRYVRSKHWVIRRYEIGLSQRLMDDGLRCAALYPYDSAAAAYLAAYSTSNGSDPSVDDEAARASAIRTLVVRDIPVNPSHFLWEPLLTHLACPFLKRQLLVENPGRVPYTHRWPELVAAVGDYDPSLIADDLRTPSTGRQVASMSEQVTR